MDPPPAALVLAAGFGTRLRPLTDLRPKALCPVNGVPLLDLALARVAPVAGPGRVAVNVHHHGQSVVRHLEGCGIHLSIEDPEPLGTAGAVGAVREWLAGEPVIVVNSDAWSTIDLGALTSGWDGERVRILALDRPGDLGVATFAGASLLPWSVASELRAEPGGLYELVWRDALAGGRAELVVVEGDFIDCGTPARYLAANLLASGGDSVIGAGAAIGADAEVVRSVVWDGASVGAGERLVDSIRADGGLTVGPLR